MRFGNGDEPSLVSRMFEAVEWIRRHCCPSENVSRLVSIGALIAVVGCGSDGRDAPLPDDPDGSTVTPSEPIVSQLRRTIEFAASDLQVSNEFAAARLNEFSRVNDTLYEALIRPETAPINSSAWYGFKMWAPDSLTVWVRLTYEDGSHRYIPKLSRDKTTWRAVDVNAYRADTSAGTALMRLDVSRDTLWVFAQERSTSEQFYSWMNAYASNPAVLPSMIARSVEDRPIVMLDITSNREANRFVLVIGRQHPPEFSGSLALLTFLNRIVESDSLAHAFRSKYRVLAVPLVNPDGVDGGHWWHNANGVDLNRDWARFTQPETSAVRDAFVTATRSAPNGQVLFALDFHSTRDAQFITLDRSLKTVPEGFIDFWLEGIKGAAPGFEVRDVPSGPESPVSLNWFYRQFGTSAIALNFGDEQDREQIAVVARASANEMMRLLLKVEHP